MKRADGYRVRGNDPMYEIVPHIMPHRYDASNYIKQEIDLDLMQDYIKKCRKKGIAMSHMSIIIAGYLRLVSQNPYLNRFVVNKKIYARNHFCACFVTLTNASENGDTVNKVYFNLDDDIFTVNQKIADSIDKIQNQTQLTAMDKLAAKLCRIPFLLSFGVAFLKRIDYFFSLPMNIIDASPFHTSLFVTNLASIRTNSVYHHIYDFGTAGVFVAMGQPVKTTIVNGEKTEAKKKMELAITTDERIANGHYFGKCFKELNRYYRNPEILETKPEKIVWDPDVKQSQKGKYKKWVTKHKI